MLSAGGVSNKTDQAPRVSEYISISCRESPLPHLIFNIPHNNRQKEKTWQGQTTTQIARGILKNLRIRTRVKVCLPETCLLRHYRSGVRQVLNRVRGVSLVEETQGNWTCFFLAVLFVRSCECLNQYLSLRSFMLS